MKKINAITGQGFSHPKASQKEAFSLAGPLSLIFSSAKVTASDSPEVTVSMTSEASKLYSKCDSGSHLNSPELGSAKSRHYHSAMQGVCADKTLNIKEDSAFLQTEDKEKGPRPALRVMQLLTCEEANELHHNLPLQATGNLSYSHDQHPNKTGAGFDIPTSKADIRRYKRFFCVRNQRCAPIMVGRSGGALALAGFFATGMSTPLRLATPFDIGGRGSIELSKEATAMVATAQTRPEFIDTYWIVPEYATTPYGKVSFTRQERRTFNSMFKDSRLIWAGRKPVQGRVNITPPSAITNIVTVQEVAHV